MLDDDLDADHREADRRALRVSVATKEAPRQRWIDCAQAQPGLRQAMQRAQALSGQYHEVAVFVDGYIYWTSRYPDLLNSTVVRIQTS